jgi:murein DD-endopeptidase MepM/ murein hydrolase activator NlpD
MGKKFLSLIIIPHNKSSYRTLSFSKKSLKRALWGSVAVAGLLLLGTVDYVRIRITQKSYRALLSENQSQKEALSRYEGSIGELEKKVKGFGDYVAKLNLIAGLKSPEVMKGLGVGGESYSPAEQQAGPNGPQTLSSGIIQNIHQKTEDIQKNFDTLVNFFEAQAARLATTPTIWPTKGLLTATFGWRPDPFTGQQAFHYGIDIATPSGNPVVAAAAGIVIEVQQNKFLGKFIKISHSGGITTVYGHLSRFNVHVGQKVQRGDLIGEVGSTGKSNGPHLHYEVQINGKAVNPYYYILEEQ